MIIISKKDLSLMIKKMSITTSRLQHFDNEKKEIKIKMEKKTKGTFVLNQPSPLLFYLAENYLNNLLFPFFFCYPGGQSSPFKNAEPSFFP